MGLTDVSLSFISTFSIALEMFSEGWIFIFGDILLEVSVGRSQFTAAVWHYKPQVPFSSLIRPQNAMTNTTLCNPAVWGCMHWTMVGNDATLCFSVS